MRQAPSLDEARRIIRDPNLPWACQVEAASVITSSKDANYGDLLACLRLRGLPAESAACMLCVLTDRGREDERVESIILDHDDWEKYLREYDYLLSSPLLKRHRTLRK